MNPFAETRDNPDKPAIIVGEETMSYRELDLSSRAAAASLRRRGLMRGDVAAILAPNGPAFFIAAWAARRSGLYYKPIGRHLKAAEIAYILGDSGAKGLFVEGSLAGLAAEALRELPPDAAPACFGLGGSIDGMAMIEDLPPEDTNGIEDVEGGDLLYTLGTTGRPKGVKRPLDFGPLGSDARRVTRLRDLFEMGKDTVFYTPAPIYHAAPLRFAMTVLRGARLWSWTQSSTQRPRWRPSPDGASPTANGCRPCSCAFCSCPRASARRSGRRRIGRRSIRARHAPPRSSGR
jgi:long-chain acyl-CoA synthetase